LRNLGRAGWRITALVGREVKQTFSQRCRLSTGLPGLKTREASGQDFGDFGNVRRITSIHAVIANRFRRVIFDELGRAKETAKSNRQRNGSKKK
jgi:hypothetical protein